MKKLILYIFTILFACVLIGCKQQYEYQKGIVVDVQYFPSHSRVIKLHEHHNFVQPGPCVKNVKPHWVAHVHYNDTICVYQNFNSPVSQGQVVYRKTRVKTKK